MKLKINWDELKKTFVKSLIWRIIAFIRGTFISWLFLRDIGLSLKISMAGTVVAFITYFIYELAWNKWANGNKNK